jgi:hypothetical protein
VTDGSDPGWAKAARRGWFYFFIPFPLFEMSRNNAGVDGLTRLRTLLLAFAWVPMLIILVSTSVADGWDPGVRTSVAVWTAVAVAGIGLLEVGLVLWQRRRLLLGPRATADELNDPSQLAIGYRATVLLGLAFSESAFLWGFVAACLTRRAEIIFVGVPFMLVGLMLCAPTRREIERRQRELVSRGSTVSFVEALRGSSAPLTARLPRARH